MGPALRLDKLQEWVNYDCGDDPSKMRREFIPWLIHDRDDDHHEVASRPAPTPT